MLNIHFLQSIVGAMDFPPEHKERAVKKADKTASCCS